MNRACAAIVVALATPAYAQFETAAVLGSVRDGAGRPVAGATVTLLNLDTGLSSTRTTDERGDYEFFTVRIGTYRVTGKRAGSAPTVAEGVKVTIGSRQRVDLVIEAPPQAAPQQALADLSLEALLSVTVSRLEIDSSQRGQVIGREEVLALPLNGREYSTLVLLSAGTRLSAINTGSLTPREGSFNVNGLRSTFNNFLLDGMDNNAYGTSNQGFSNQVMQPSPDTVAEFKVVTNNMGAEYGRSGGATINVALASGTNEFRGAAWEYLRDTALNAAGFFKSPDGRKPPLTRNQFGLAGGGPVVRSRAFFFVDYEGFRQRFGRLAFSTIPTLAQRQGILPVTVANPQTGAVYPAGVPIPESAINPVARRVLGGLPAPTNPGEVNNYRVLQSFHNDSDKFGAKLDVRLTSKLEAFVRYGHRRLDTFDQPPIPLPSGGSGNGSTFVKNDQLAAGLTWAPSGKALLEVRLGLSRTRAGKRPPALGTAPAEDSYGITGLPDDPRVAGGLPTQIIPGFSDLGRQPTNPQWQYPDVLNPKLNYNRTLGRHSLKAGYEFQSVTTEVQDVNPLYGRDEYAGRFSRPAGVSGDDRSYALADFMFGLRSRYALTNLFIAHLRQQFHFAYVQDDFHPTRRLTLNLGLRYEYATPQYERENQLSNFDPTLVRMVTAKPGSIADRALIDPDRKNLAPRLGLAFSIDRRTALRAAYGVSYVHFNRAGAANILPINGPQVINAVVDQTDPLDPSFRRTDQGYPAGLTDPSRFDPLRANVTYMPRDFHSGLVQSWFVSVQRELPWRMLLDVAYVGNRADDLLLFANLNQAAPNDSAGSRSLQSRRPIPSFGDITYAFNGGFSRYRSLQARVERRVWDLTFLSSFTWSRAVDNGAGALEGSATGNLPSPQDFHDLAAEEAPSAYDQPLTSVTSLVWEVPVGRGRRHLASLPGWADAVLGGWRIGAINSMWSGQPITLTYNPRTAFQVSGITQDFRGANNYRPNLVGDPLAPPGQRSPDNYFNKGNVVIPTDPSHPFGNAPRNPVRSDAFYQLDASFAKGFPLRGDAKLELRVEIFNLLNKTNFRPANGNRSSPAFGTITSSFDPRQVQLALKLIY